MSPRTTFILTMLALLLLANILMVVGFTNYPTDEEGFINYIMSGAGIKDGYEPIGAYDAMVKKPEHGMSYWRGPSPEEALKGPEVEMGPDSLFLFKNNQCKPECCGASFSCGSGCVCTTSKQRDLINSRGGNRTEPVDL